MEKELTEQEEEIHNALVKLSETSNIEASTIIGWIEDLKIKAKKEVFNYFREKQNMLLTREFFDDGEKRHLSTFDKSKRI